jgi:rare lipoprotein A
MLLLSVVPACARHKPPAVTVPPPRPPFSQTGMASWYGPGFAGKLTANGERFDPDALTCAHPKLPFDTKLEVTNLENGKRVVVRVNDRGPFAKDRVIDLSKEAAKRLGFLDKGTARVRLDSI